MISSICGKCDELMWLFLWFYQLFSNLQTLIQSKMNFNFGAYSFCSFENITPCITQFIREVYISYRVRYYSFDVGRMKLQFVAITNKKWHLFSVAAIAATYFHLKFISAALFIVITYTSFEITFFCSEVRIRLIFFCISLLAGSDISFYQSWDIIFFIKKLHAN